MTNHDYDYASLCLSAEEEDAQRDAGNFRAASALMDYWTDFSFWHNRQMHN